MHMCVVFVCACLCTHETHLCVLWIKCVFVYVFACIHTIIKRIFRVTIYNVFMCVCMYESLSLLPSLSFSLSPTPYLFSQSPPPPPQLSSLSLPPTPPPLLSPPPTDNNLLVLQQRQAMACWGHSPHSRCSQDSRADSHTGRRRLAAAACALSLPAQLLAFLRTETPRHHLER